MAGRMPEDFKNIILQDPEQMPALPRAASNLAPEQLKTDRRRKAQEQGGRRLMPSGSHQKNRVKLLHEKQI